MENYKIIKADGKYKQLYAKDRAMELMKEMDIGEKFYIDVTKETAKNWIRYFCRKIWYKRLKSSSRWKNMDNVVIHGSNVRDLVEFEAGSDIIGSYIMKTRHTKAYTEEKYNPKYGKDFKIKIEEVGFSQRTLNVLQSAGFKYLEELKTFSKEDTYRYKNMGLKTYREIRDILNAIPSLCYEPRLG
tara:strand:- start:210 stop:767 length:558 start_codon:yes stop_codon:yes gene_type:complete